MQILHYLKTKTFIIHYIITIGLIIYIIFADNIFANIKQFQESNLIKNLIIEQDSNNQQLDFSISPIQATKLEWKDVIMIKGWAFLKNNTPDDRIYILLKSANNGYIFDTMQYTAADVTAYFKNIKKTTDNSSFIANIPLETITNGTYNIGIIIQNQKGNNYLKLSQNYIYIYNGKVLNNFIAQPQSLTQ